MQYVSDQVRALASIERRLADLMLELQHQSITVARLRDELTAAQRQNDWYNVQFSEMLRLLAHRSGEMRAALLYSVVSERPLSPEVLQALLQLSQAESTALSDRHELENISFSIS